MSTIFTSADYNALVDKLDVIIPNGYTSIGNEAFKNALSLTSITIPNSVTSIGYKAFNAAGQLSQLSVSFEPNSTLATIGVQAFANATSLTSINIPNTVSSIGNGAFFATALHSIIIPASVTNFGTGVFQSAVDLSSVTFEAGSTLATIGNDTFNNTTKLTSITIPDSVTSIGDQAFLTSGITSITIPNSVTSLGMGVFWDAVDLSSVTFEAGSTLTTIGNYAFLRATSLTSITIPNSVTSLGTGVFMLATDLSSVIFQSDSSLTTIGDNAFKNATSLTSITIPNSITSIGNSAFNGTTDLLSVTFETGSSLLQMNGIGNNAFVNSGLTTIYANLPLIISQSWDVNGPNIIGGKTGVIVIDPLASVIVVNIYDINVTVLRNSQEQDNEIIFMDDSEYDAITKTKEFIIINKNAEASITITDNKCNYQPPINTPGSDTFQYYFKHDGVNSNPQTVYITINSIIITSDNKSIYSTIDIDLSGNRVLSINKEVGIIGSNVFANNDANINILQFDFKIDNIRTCAFKNNPNLHTIIFNGGVDIIGDSAFYFTNVSKIIYLNKTYFINGNTLEIPTNTINIGGLFNSQTHFYNDANNNILIPSSAFIYNNLTTLKLPDSLVNINNGALRYSKITSLVLPKNLILIEFHAFYGNNIENLFVSDTLSTVYYGSFNEYIIQNYYVYNYSTLTVYQGNLQELAANHDYEPLVVATTTEAKMTDIIGTIIPKELFVYSEYISTTSKEYNYVAIEDTLLSINIRDITNISTVNGSIITFIESTRGNFSFNDPTIYFTPELNSIIKDGFIYEEKYNNDDVELGTVFINIIPVNDVPVSYNVDISMNEDTTKQIDFSYNDIDTPISDLSYNILSQPSSGVLTSINNNNVGILYTPDNNFFGDVSFTYSISDLHLESNISTINIQVNHVNEPPIVYDISKTIYENGIGFTQTITYQDIDSSNDVITYHIYNSPTNGIATLNNNILNYISNTDYYGLDNLQYYVMDGDLSSNVGNINITILPFISRPQVFDLKIQTKENESVTIILDNIYEDDDGRNINDISLVFVNTVKYGILSKIENQKYVYNPNSYFNGFDNFSYYLIAPNNTQSINATVDINVLKVQYAGCKYCPPKVIFERNNNTHFNASGKIHMAHRNIRNEGKGCNTFVSQSPSIIVPPKNNF